MHPPPSGLEALGVYGLRLRGLDQAGDLLVAAPPGWTDIEVVRRVDPNLADTRSFLDDQRAVVTLGEHCGVAVSRPDAEVVFTLPHPVPDGHVVHPYLSLPAAIVNRWLGRECFHAGAAVVAGGAWAVCGPQSGGKSSTLGWLATNGVAVLSDDLLVLDGLDALAGPRCIDLRQETAAELQMGVPIGMVGSRERWRMHPGPVDPAVPLLGWVFLAWADTVDMVPVPPAERLSRLFGHEALGLGPAQPVDYLDLAGLPAWELRRPRRLTSLAEAGRRLVDTISASVLDRS